MQEGYISIFTPLCMASQEQLLGDCMLQDAKLNTRMLH